MTEHHLEFLSLKGGCTDSAQSLIVKMLNLLEMSCHCSNSRNHYDLSTLISSSYTGRDTFLGARAREIITHHIWERLLLCKWCSRKFWWSLPSGTSPYKNSSGGWSTVWCLKKIWPPNMYDSKKRTKEYLVQFVVSQVSLNAPHGF